MPAVGRQDDRGLQVALADDLEQRGRGVSGEGQVAELVDDEQCEAGEEAHRVGSAALDRGPVAAGGEVGGGGEVGAVAAFGGLAREADRDVGFPALRT